MSMNNIFSKRVTEKSFAVFMAALILFSLFSSIVLPAVSEAASLPSVQTNSPSSVTTNSATLNGEAVPNEASTDVWFEWGTSPSNLSNSTAVENIGSGTSSVAYAKSITGLNSGTLYHYRAVAQNSEGIDFGNIVSFTTDGSSTTVGVPDATTLSPRNIEDDRARLHGEVRPNGLDTEVWFEWGSSSTNLNEDTSRRIISGSSSFATFDTLITGLDDDRTYFYRAVAENEEGIDRGIRRSFRTDDTGGSSGGSGRPNIRSVDVDRIEDDRARLICEVDANDSDTDVWFEWDRSESDVRNGRGEETRRVDVDRDETRQEVRITITGLNDDTRYYFMCVARNSDGTEESRIEDFRTDDRGSSSSNSSDPKVVTLSTINIFTTSARLRGTVDPNGEDTDVWFEWSAELFGYENSTRVEDVGDGTRAENFDFFLTGLRPGTQYYYRAVGENREGTDTGVRLGFKTQSVFTASVTPVAEPEISSTSTTRIPSSPFDLINRVIDAFRGGDEGLVIILNVDTRRSDRSEIIYEVSYDNRSRDTFRDTFLTITVPDELEFVDADPKEDDEDKGRVIFDLGSVRPGDEGTFIIETEILGNLSSRDEIIFVASIAYTEDEQIKVFTIMDVTRIGDFGRGGIGATFAASLGNLFTSPILWILILISVIFFVYRYFAALAKPREDPLLFNEPMPSSILEENDFMDKLPIQ